MHLQQVFQEEAAVKRRQEIWLLHFFPRHLKRHFPTESAVFSWYIIYAYKQADGSCKSEGMAPDLTAGSGGSTGAAGRSGRLGAAQPAVPGRRPAPPLGRFLTVLFLLQRRVY